jgi:hypothetical protein
LETLVAASEIGMTAAIMYTGQGRRLSQLFLSDTQSHLFDSNSPGLSPVRNGPKYPA